MQKKKMAECGKLSPTKVWLSKGPFKNYVRAFGGGVIAYTADSANTGKLSDGKVGV